VRGLGRLGLSGEPLAEVGLLRLEPLGDLGLGGGECLLGGDPGGVRRRGFLRLHARGGLGLVPRLVRRRRRLELLGGELLEVGADLDVLGDPAVGVGVRGRRGGRRCLRDPLRLGQRAVGVLVRGGHRLLGLGPGGRDGRLGVRLDGDDGGRCLGLGRRHGRLGIDGRGGHRGARLPGGRRERLLGLAPGSVDQRPGLLVRGGDGLVGLAPGGGELLVRLLPGLGQRLFGGGPGLVGGGRLGGSLRGGGLGRDPRLVGGRGGVGLLAQVVRGFLGLRPQSLLGLVMGGGQGSLGLLAGLVRAGGLDGLLGRSGLGVLAGLLPGRGHPGQRAGGVLGPDPRLGQLLELRLQFGLAAGGVLGRLRVPAYRLLRRRRLRLRALLGLAAGGLRGLGGGLRLGMPARRLLHRGLGGDPRLVGGRRGGRVLVGGPVGRLGRTPGLRRALFGSESLGGLGGGGLLGQRPEPCRGLRGRRLLAGPRLEVGECAAGRRGGGGLVTARLARSGRRRGARCLRAARAGRGLLRR